MKIYLIKQFNNSLKIAYDSDYEKLKKWKAGDILECNISKPRNGKFHRKFMALINLCFQNQEIYSDMDRLRKDLISQAGFIKKWVDFNGEIRHEAKSISFSKMNEFEFGELYNKVLDVIIDIFKHDKQKVIDEIEQYF